jgi:hypothetical protein
MFEFYRDCVFELSSNLNYYQLIAPLVAIIAIIISVWNLNIVKRNQKIQTHISILNIQKDIDDRQIRFNIINKKYSEIKYNDREKYSDELDDSFKQYLTSVERLGVLLRTEYVKKQFDDKTWKDEYFVLFNDAKNIYDSFANNLVLKHSVKIKNIDEILKTWK